jgi:hypothetical protein
MQQIFFLGPIVFDKSDILRAAAFKRFEDDEEVITEEKR